MKPIYALYLFFLDLTRYDHKLFDVHPSDIFFYSSSKRSDHLRLVSDIPDMSDANAVRDKDGTGWGRPINYLRSTKPIPHLIVDENYPLPFRGLPRAGD